MFGLFIAFALHVSAQANPVDSTAARLLQTVLTQLGVPGGDSVQHPLMVDLSPFNAAAQRALGDTLMRRSHRLTGEIHFTDARVAEVLSCPTRGRPCDARIAAVLVYVKGIERLPDGDVQVVACRINADPGASRGRQSTGTEVSLRLRWTSEEWRVLGGTVRTACEMGALVRGDL